MEQAQPNYKHKCYQTKDDHRHNTIIVSRPVQVSQERWESIFGPEEERKRKLREWKKEKKQISEVNAPAVHIWDEERSVLATGMRMSKRELKNYARQHGKIIEQY